MTTARDQSKLTQTGVEDWLPEQGRWANLLERLALWLEKPVNRLSGTTQLNPFYHTGTISVFLLLVVGFTGFYLYIFFQYGFDASYEAVERLEGMIIGRFVRAMHRYASGALVITAFLHAYRMLFMGRFRGARWLAWVTGMFMVAILWAAGVTGYWVIGDTRAQLINEAFIQFLESFTGLAPSFTNWLVRSESGDSWQLFVIVIWVHILLFLLVAGFFIYHIKRLNRPQWMPEIQWVAGMSIVLVLGSLIFPVGMLAQADPTIWPQSVTYDPIFLSFLPTMDRPFLAWIIWGFCLSSFLLFTLLPWLPRRRGRRPRIDLPTVTVIDERCTGCTRCAVDCPYQAITIEERPPEAVYKFIAIPHPERCVSCGICIGSCTDEAITLGNFPPEQLPNLVREQIARARQKGRRGDEQDQDIKLVFTCERFANQSARPYLQQTDESLSDAQATLAVIALPCAGAVPPDLLIQAIDEGAAEVRVIGCPPNDCAHREGNLWAEGRLIRQRAPMLKKAYANLPISAAWLPPDSFAKGLETSVHADESNWLETRRLFRQITWKNLVPAFSLLAMVLVVQILLSDLNFRPAAAEGVQVQVILTDLGEPLGDHPAHIAWRPRPTWLRLQLEGNGRLLLDEAIPFLQLLQEGQTPFFAELSLPEGEHRLSLFLLNEATKTRYLIQSTKGTHAAGDILRLTYEGAQPVRCRGSKCPF